MLGALVYENIDNVQRIFDHEVGELMQRRILTKQLQAVVEYVNFYFSSHFCLDSDPLQDTGRALHGTCARNRAIDSSSCSSCLVPFQVLASVKEWVETPSPDTCEQ